MANAKSMRTIPALPVAPEGIEYRLLKDYPGYAVGSDGTVWSCRRGGRWGVFYSTTWQIKKVFPNAKGYLVAQIRYADGAPSNNYVHKLVLLSFVGPRPEGMECRHLDGNNQNNNLSNIEWNTPEVNRLDRVLHGSNVRCGARGTRNPKARFTEEQIREMRRLKATHTYYELGDMFGCDYRYVFNIVKRKSWKGVD